MRARRYLLEASANSRLGHDDEVNSSLERAERECANPDTTLSADLANMKGVLEVSPAAAENSFLKALELARKEGDTYREAGALLNIGQAAMNQERYDESIEWNTASVSISEPRGYRLYEEKANGNLAWAYYKLGDFERALPLFNEAERQANSLDAGYERIRWRNDLGVLHEKLGQLTAAEGDYRQALGLAQEQGDQNQTTIALAELAFVSIKTGHLDEAEGFGKQAFELAHKDEDRPLELAALFAQGLIASRRGDRATAERLLSEVARDPNHDRQSARWEAQTALADLYAEEGRAGVAETEYRVALETVRQARCSIEHEDLRLPFLANATRVYGSYIDFLVRHRKAAEALEVADESRALTLAEGLGIEGKKCLASEAAFDPQGVARRANATLLFYWLGPEHSYLWAVGPVADRQGRMKLFPLPAAAEIEPAVEAYRKALVGPRDVLHSNDGEGDPDGAKLYRTLVAPAAEFFHPNGRVIVIADGALSGLSFEALIAPRPAPHFWIEDVTVENASSLRLLAAAPAKRATATGKLLLMGDPLPPAANEYAALPKAAEEMRIVRRYFPTGDEQVLDRGQATANAYLASRPEQFSYIHFVAHGTASLSDPLDSAVVLSPSTADGGYKLYARDVIAHPLRAELVTVSTCKGAGARAYTGEGMVGLSWAFLRAGAHNVIGALWDVSDSSTPQLMDTMYAQLTKGNSPDAALREAKLSLLHSGGVYRRPIYWAAFQLYTGS
jgi:CHAT domain-containing protein/Tfp pilus assembly protein PilF